MSKVYVAKGNAYNATKKTLELSNFKALIRKKSKIVIKPNLVVARKAHDGVTTDVNVVRAILDQIPTNKKVSIVEGSSEATTSFKLNGYYDLEKEYNVEIIDANFAEYEKIKVKNSFILNDIQISKKVLRSDFLISVGKLKIHSVAKVTATLKNMMGVCPKPQKLKIHSYIPRSLVDLLSVRMPDFGILDGVVVNEIDENLPHPIKLGLILTSKDCVALDFVASNLIGINPLKVSYIVLAHEKGLGSIEKIEIIGEQIEGYRKNLKSSFFNPRSFGQKVITRLLMNIGLFIWYNEKIIPQIIKTKKMLRLSRS